MGRVGFVYFDHRFAGTLAKDKNDFIFTYDPAYISVGTPLSFNLPIQEESFKEKQMFSFFENLASEGWLKQIQCKTQKIDKNDIFSLLLENGTDLIGAVAILKGKNEVLQDKS